MDTAEKRRSAAGVPFLPLGPGVTPNVSQDQEWRQQAAWGYSGVLAAEAEEPSGPAGRVIWVTLYVPGAVAAAVWIPGGAGAGVFTGGQPTEVVS